MESAELKQLILATANGEQVAFQSLYERTSPYLLSLAMGIVNRRRDVAEDILQDAFVQIWHRASDYHVDKGAPLSWMAGIVRFRALDARRREKSQQDRADASAQELELEIPLAGLDKLAETSEEVAMVIGCMDSIQQDQRESILLAYCYGYSHGELAKKLAKPLGTVKTMIRRGMAVIRECLKV